MSYYLFYSLAKVNGIVRSFYVLIVDFVWNIGDVELK